MSFHIEGVGTASPLHFVEQNDAAEMASRFCIVDESQRRLLPALYRRSGVHSRRSVLLESSTDGQPARQSFYPYATSVEDRGPTTAQRMAAYGTHACELGIPAVQRALVAAARHAQEITQLITITCSGFHAPGFDVTLIERCGLSQDVGRTQIGFMGCHGALNGLRVAKSLAEADPAACVLMVALELCSLHHQYGWTPNRIVSNSLFADGAAALVGSRGADQAWRVTHSGSTIVHGTQDLMTWRISDHGFEMSLSPAVPEVIEQHLPAWMDAWLARCGRRLADIESWAIHPGGPRILSACAAGLGLQEQQLAMSYQILQQYGNMSSPTVLFTLDRMRESHGT